MIFGISIETFETFALILTRVSLMIAVAPLLGTANVPTTLKAGLSLFLSLLIIPFVEPVSILGGNPALNFLFVMSKEALVGLMFGFAAGLVFYALQFSGQFISIQMGFAMVQVLDPQTQNRVPILGQFYYIMAVLIFLVLNGHHIFIMGIMDSFHLIALGGANFGGILPEVLINMGGRVFVVALQISSPILVTLFLTDIALGIIARTVPQMNIFFVGLPLKIGVGLTLIIFTLSFFPWLLEKLVAELEQNVELVMRML